MDLTWKVVAMFDRQCNLAHEAYVIPTNLEDRALVRGVIFNFILLICRNVERITHIF